MDFMEMWTKVEKLVTAKGLNWAKLARMIGETDARISRWRSGTGEPDRNQLLRIARALEADLEYLADDSIDEPGTPQNLGDDELAVIQAYRAFRPRLDQTKAIRALSAAFNAEERESRNGVVGQPVDPQTGELLDPTNQTSGKRRRQA